ncbi:MAG TPA: Rieske 2Fe-2S domain-containing protein [Spirochaetota bacterium]|nr:Rieske 2Fe-2S domain-containing protein [Spirochaetota bacterium]HPJ36220.1 Rieske 2Fe-2S domain-containing protein [Spirochaetota bacterium]
MGNRTVFQRIFGISASKVASSDSWSFDGSVLRIDPGRLPEISASGGGVRIEGKGLPDRFLLLHGRDGDYHLFSNRCRHGGRRLDPDGDGLQCCSLGKSAYDINGTVRSGPAKKNLKKYAIRRENNYIIAEV